MSVISMLPTNVRSPLPKRTEIEVAHDERGPRGRGEGPRLDEAKCVLTSGDGKAGVEMHIDDLHNAMPPLQQEFANSAPPKNTMPKMREARSKARMENNNATTFDATREESAVRVQTLDLLFQIHEVLLGPVSFLKSDNGAFRDETAKFRHRVDDRLNRRRGGTEESLHIPRYGKE
eukprot:6664986-Pyramimonas_sp.AAC.1